MEIAGGLFLHLMRKAGVHIVFHFNSERIGCQTIYLPYKVYIAVKVTFSESEGYK